MSTTTRLTAAERAHFAGPYGTVAGTEPAMGTLDQRLGIIIRRLGGRTGAVRASVAERHEHAVWLAKNGLAS